MNWKELECILSALDQNIKTDYEQLRMIIHSIYQVNSTKQINPTDILKFSWEIEQEPEIVEADLLDFEKAKKLINNI